MENESENACKSPPFVLLRQPPEGAIAKIHTMEGHAIRGLKGYLAILMLPSQKKGVRLRMTLKYAGRQHLYVVAVVFAAIRVFSRITKGSLLVV